MAGQSSTASSTATTVHYPLEAATRNAMKGLSLKDPHTPQDRIRRTTTPVLSGPIGDQPLFAPQPTDVSHGAGAVNTTAAPTVPTPPNTSSVAKKGAKKNGKGMSKKGKKTIKNHVKGKAKTSAKPCPVVKSELREQDSTPAAAVSVPTAVAPTAPPPTVSTQVPSALAPQQQPSQPPATAPAQPPAEPVRPTAAKAAAKKPEMSQQADPLPPCKLEKIERKPSTPTISQGVKPPPTPPSVRENRAAEAALNVTRTTTREQIGTPHAASPAPSAHGKSAAPSEAAAEDENGDDETDAGDADQADVQMGEGSGEKPQEEKTKKKKKELTPQQKSAHARYMRFSRSVRSILTALFSTTTNMFVPKRSAYI